MKLMMTLLVRDEIDIVESQLSYHLNAGVDFVIATDHDSHDGTTEVLESHEREGHLHLIRERGRFRESAWRTRMARLAASDHGADWVINTDADEFWMPRDGSLKEILASIPASYGIVWALTNHFLPRSGDCRAFFERMTVRLSSFVAINDPTSPYRPHAKAAHRGVTDIMVRHGAHLANSPSLRPLRDWYPLDVCHFPFRSPAQYERKGVRGVRDSKPLGQYVKAALAREVGRVENVYGRLAIDDATLERGLASGFLVEDTRLRDALRRVDRLERLPRSAQTSPSDSRVSARVAAGVEGGSLRDADLVRLRRRLDMLDTRVTSIETHQPIVLGTTAAL